MVPLRCCVYAFWLLLLIQFKACGFLDLKNWQHLITYAMLETQETHFVFRIFTALEEKRQPLHLILKGREGEVSLTAIVSPAHQERPSKLSLQTKE